MDDCHGKLLHGLAIDNYRCFEHNAVPKSNVKVYKTLIQNGKMKYLTLILLFSVIYYVIGEFVFKDRSSEGLTKTAEKWKDLGRRIHQSVGIIALMMIIILIIRFIYHAIDSYWRL